MMTEPALRMMRRSKRTLRGTLRQNVDDVCFVGFVIVKLLLIAGSSDVAVDDDDSHKPLVWYCC